MMQKKQSACEKTQTSRRTNWLWKTWMGAMSFHCPVAAPKAMQKATKAKTPQKTATPKRQYGF